MRPASFITAIALTSLGLSATARAQDDEGQAARPRAAEPAKGQKFKSRADLAAHYEKQFLDVDRARIKDMTALAESSKEAEAEAIYQDILNLAVARDLYESAEPAAEAYLEGQKRDPRTRALASFVDIIAAAEREQYDEALKRLERFLQALDPAPAGAAPSRPVPAGANPAAETPKAAAPTAPATPARTTPPAPAGANARRPDAAPQLDQATTFAVGEAFLQRLIRDGRHDIARRVAQLFVDHARDQAVKGHFASRLERLEMVGKPAPALVGSDLDGQSINLAELKGKVVLVDFWASWAPTSMALIPYYNALDAKYPDKDFAVVGVNLDAMREGLRPEAVKQLNPALRRYLVGQGVKWPVVMNGTGANDWAKAFGVTNIPANFLIDRDGKIIRVEVFGTELDKAIASAIGGSETTDPERKPSARVGR